MYFPAEQPAVLLLRKYCLNHQNKRQPLPQQQTVALHDCKTLPEVTVLARPTDLVPNACTMNSNPNFNFFKLKFPSFKMNYPSFKLNSISFKS